MRSCGGIYALRFLTKRAQLVLQSGTDLGHRVWWPLLFQCRHRSILAFTNSGNRAVINSTVALPSQLGGGQLLLGRSLGIGSPVGLLLFHSWRGAFALPSSSITAHGKRCVVLGDFWI